MDINNRMTHTDDDTISLVEVFETLWASKIYIASFIAVTVLLATSYLIIAAPKYTANMIVAPTEEQSSSSSMGALGQLSALSGINIGGTEESARFGAFIDIFASRTVAERLSIDAKLMHRIFEKEWNEKKGEWNPESGFLASISRIPNLIFGQPTWAPPSSNRLAEYLGRHIRVNDFGDSGMKEISFDYKDPVFAAEFLSKVYDAADEELKSDALIRSRQYIAYLEHRLMTVSVAEHRQVLSQLLIGQEQTQMLIESDLPYAARVISSAKASDLPTKPNIMSTFIIAFLIGAFLGTIWVFLFQSSRNV